MANRDDKVLKTSTDLSWVWVFDRILLGSSGVEGSQQEQGVGE